jgi:hypothetical protein
MPKVPQSALGFSCRVSKSGEVQVRRNGLLAATVRGTEATIFLTKVGRASYAVAQQRLARLTGNHKRDNERAATAHLRNRA